MSCEIHQECGTTCKGQKKLLKTITKLQTENEKLSGALEVFSNRRKLAHSLRAESPHIAAFMYAVGIEIDKALAATESDTEKDSYRHE